MFIKIDTESFQNNVNLRKILKISGEILTGENVIEIDETNVTEIIESKHTAVWNISTNKIQNKTEEQLKLDKLTLMQGTVLRLLVNINTAISAQQSTNAVLATPVYTISISDIQAIGEYQNKITTFHQTWNPSEYTLDSNNQTLKQIDIHMFNGDIELPEIVTRLLNY